MHSVPLLSFLSIIVGTLLVIFNNAFSDWSVAFVYRQTNGKRIDYNSTKYVYYFTGVIMILLGMLNIIMNSLS